MAENSHIIGRLIRDLRTEKNITQAALAEAIGTTQSAVARMEAGEQNFTVETLEKVSEALERDLFQLPDGALNIKITGGSELSGTIETKSSKNAAVGLLCASLLNHGTTTLKNMPRIEEVNRIIEVFESLGISVKRDGPDIVITPPETLSLEGLDAEAARRTRSVIMMIGPLVHHLSQFTLPQAGGCKLGSRTVRPHFYALEPMGISIEATDEGFAVSRNSLKSADIVLYESGDTVTENALMAAANIPGVTTIKYATSNYMVQDVCLFLEKLGVKIEGIGTTTLKVHGVSGEIKKDVTYYVSEDPIESMFFLAAAITTRSSITITRCPIDFLEVELLKLEKMGFQYEMSERYLSRNGHTALVDITTKPSELVALEEKIHPLPYPGLNADNLPFFAVIATQATGTTFLHDWMYEKRAIYFTELEKLGASMVLVDPHRLYVEGPTTLKPAEVISPPALRPAAVILIAMLAARGESTLRNIYSINRGYEDIVNRLNRLGAKIEIIRS